MTFEFKPRLLKNLLLGTIVLLTSCKATKSLPKGVADPSLGSKKVIANHYNSTIDFNTIRGSLKIDYDDGENSQSFRVSLRMKKDEIIWISAPFNVVKAKITPNKVEFFNKLDKEYFEGEFDYLSGLLGTELDFEKVQNLLLGDAVLDLREDKYTIEVAGGNYQLKPKRSNELFKILFAIEPKTFRIATQEVSQPWENRFLTMEYSYQEIETRILPNEIFIEATANGDLTKINLEYKNVEFNQSMNYPYKVPKGFKRIELD
ncbi:DUF4292 domain-containing protein [Croceivirga thetidis]|uniref:DUF4292 domain-containing protein n=1 Tax=Croceivirga thetidis TaxID=2721623 RepID=A0ABX1GND6_9FLAO|nr:DUF4292 domain-containing protein [Croceivirga thetidis]NKI31154.1 DUF4292 domain-containing protein [Croceivirga thetidis]